MPSNLTPTHNLIGIHDSLQAMSDSTNTDVVELGTYELLNEIIGLVIFHYVSVGSF